MAKRIHDLLGLPVDEVVVNECLTLKQFLWASQLAGVASFLLVTALLGLVAFVGGRRWLRAIKGGAARTDGRTPGKLAPNRFHEAAWIVGDKHEIADDVWIGAFCVIDAAHDRLVLAPGVVVASGAHIYTHSSVARTATCGAAPIEHAPTHVGPHASICANATVLMGCDVQERAVVAAGAVVPEHTVVPRDCVVAGVPARIVRRARPSKLRSGETRSSCGCAIAPDGKAIDMVCGEHEV